MGWWSFSSLLLKCGPGTSSIRILWKLDRNAESQAGMRPCTFPRLPRYSFTAPGKRESESLAQCLSNLTETDSKKYIFYSSASTHTLTHLKQNFTMHALVLVRFTSIYSILLYSYFLFFCNANLPH